VPLVRWKAVRAMPDRALTFLRRMFAAMGRSFERAYLQWASREIDPLHDDVPAMVVRLNDLERAS
jgi:hypothetical protein